ncbi:MAG TPA: glycosyltransferase family 2 protein [Candidatus Nanoarchaeia archaeon]|nr:glycosyltransferase family 2 protein [Candidatus Nanoarchaeia archaeon]
MNPTMPKVLVGCPTYDGMDYCLERYVKAVKNLSYPNYDVLLIDNSKDDKYAEKIKKLGLKVVHISRDLEPKKLIAKARNVLRQRAIEGNYDFLLSLEQDVIPPRTIIERMLRHGKKIVSGIYFKHFTIKLKIATKEIVKKQIRPILYLPIPNHEDKMHFCTAKDVEGDKLLQARMAGLGAIIIHKDVLNKIEFRVPEDLSTYDDACFADDVIKNNLHIYADTSIKCKHLILNKNDNTSK